MDMQLFILQYCAEAGVPVLVLLTVLFLLLSACAVCGGEFPGDPAMPLCCFPGGHAVPAAGRCGEPLCIRAPPVPGLTSKRFGRDPGRCGIRTCLKAVCPSTVNPEKRSLPGC